MLLALPIVVPPAAPIFLRLALHRRRRRVSSIFSQSLTRPERYGEPSRFETMPRSGARTSETPKAKLLPFRGRRSAIRAGTFPSIIWFKARLDLLEVQFKCLLSLQARYATNQRVARTFVRDRDSINRRQPSQPETASRQAVRFNVQANDHAAFATILR